MKRFIHYIAFVAAMFATTSCVEPLTSVIPGQSQDFTISFSCGTMTKAETVDGVNNENLVKRIDYFIFPYGTIEEVTDDAVCVYSGTITVPENDQLAKSYTETIAREHFAKIFPEGATKAVIFAVANYVDKLGANNSMTNPNTTLPAPAGTDYTWGELHAMEVGATFFYDDFTEDFGLRWPHTMDPLKPTENRHKGLFFVMTGEAVINLAANSDGINGKVPLKRLASKVTVNFTYVDQVIEPLITGDIVWIPQATADETRVYLSNAIEHTTLGGPLDGSSTTRPLVADSWGTATSPLGNGKRDIFEYAYNYMNDLIYEVDGKKTAHFYTYPISLDEGDDNQPFLKLVLPWYGYKYFGNENPAPDYSATNPDWKKYKQKEVYYKIVLPRESIKEPNCLYEYSAHVDIVGSDKEILVPGYDYVVKDWLSGNALESNVAMAKYLSLDIPKDYYETYVDTTEILFVSSGEVEISHLEIYTMDLRGSTPTRRYYINGTATSYVNPYGAGTTDSGNPAVTLPHWVEVEGSKLVVKHSMNTNINSQQVDIAPYTFVATLHLKGQEGTQFDRTVTITQYPPIYATTKETQNGNTTVFLNATRHNWTTTNPVYSSTQGTTGRHTLGSIGQSETSMTTSRIKTIVSVSTLADLNTTKYIAQNVGIPVIGDPTKTLAEGYPHSSYFNAQVWNAGDLRDVGNGNTTISEEYRYADPTKQNVIAPKFMVSSGFGGCPSGKTNWINNVQRCAAYQEDGYPAGRWRLPTEAEILFVYTLGAPVNQGGIALIDNPFYGESHYYSNTGRTYFHGNFEDNPADGRSVRCVYDLWYWGDDPVLTTTTTPSITQWSGFMTSK